VAKNRVEIIIAAITKTSDQTIYYALAAAYVHKNGCAPLGLRRHVNRGLMLIE
jgi:hypothetical protein